ncbi:MAG TPA: phage terminase large subunit [Gemmataceae bacterium]|nr:phage terminase large subunit [Gemmataceae bacterium]
MARIRLPSDSPNRGPYHLRGAARELFACQASEVLLSGPAGTGKSLANLLKLHLLASEIPRLRALMLRKTRESLTESALVTFEEKVLPEGHPALATGGQRRVRQAYRYPNGSTIVLGGLDKPGKVMSTEYDAIYVQEAIELEEEAWEALSTRVRHGRLPYQQLMVDTNPDRPTHWLKRRCDAGVTRLFECRHEDNPTLWDADKGDWTPGGRTYLAKLDALTGPRKQRLRFGRWVQAEGVVYEGWDSATHVIAPFEIPDAWTRYWSVDFGYTNPFVCQWWAKDPDGRLYLYRELYRVHLLVEDAAKEMTALSAGEPRSWAIVCDHDAEDRATLERHLNMKTVAAVKDVSPGIQAVATRLRNSGDGRPRLFAFRNAPVRRDPVLSEARKPTCLAEEIDGYVWKTAGGRRQGEEPLKLDDHGCDSMRYVVAEVDCLTVPDSGGPMTQEQKPRAEVAAGLSLGAVGARTSLAVLRRTDAPGGVPGPWSFRVEQLHRWDLHTPYTAVAADLGELFPPVEGESRLLAIDASVVGRLAGLFLQPPHAGKVGVEVLHIGPGVEVVKGRHGATNVPESHVAADAPAAAESGRLTFAPGVPFAQEIPQELRRFAARAGAGGRQRETDSLTVAVAVWAGENLARRPVGAAADQKERPQRRRPRPGRRLPP